MAQLLEARLTVKNTRTFSELIYEFLTYFLSQVYYSFLKIDKMT